MRMPRPRLLNWFQPPSNGRVRPLLSVVLTGVLGTSLVMAPPAMAEPPKPKHLAGQVEILDADGGEVRGIGWQPKEQPAVKLPAPVWPKAGSARVTLPAKGRHVAAKRAGGLPVSVSRVAGVVGDRLSEVAVEVIDRSKVPASWRNGVVTRVSSPRVAAAGAAELAIDYRGFQYAYGAEWSSRLRLWSLPECALTTPAQVGCAATPLPSRNDAVTGVVTAQVALAAPTSAQPSAAVAQASSVVALAAAPSGDSGDFTATSLAASSTWSVGGSSGNFSWSYPMKVPPASGGPEPTVALSYSSASVDGRSAATNNQPSWIGEGFEYSPGFIERRYVTCDDDMAGTANNHEKTGDLCWRSDNATLSLDGGGSELVYESGKGWHSRSEDGSKIEKVTGATNGDDNGEHWKVTTTDGTQYFFGLNKLPGQGSDTNSAWTAPVYGNQDGEPCHASTFADSDCAQTWRWNLDYVVDPRGNTMSYWYEKETNQYGAEVTDSKNISYVRGGALRRIDYGTWDRGTADRSVAEKAQVLFDTADRCLSECATHDAQHWPDVPWDQECKADATSCDDHAPTFWSTKRLTKVTTRVWDTTKTTAGWQNVNSWTLTHSFPSPGDGTKAGLWLASIVRTGLVGGTIAMPPITFEPVALANRVLTKINTTNNWQRISNIYSETGARTQVTYSLPECTVSNLPSAAHTNTKLCYPVIGPDPYDLDGPDVTEWWHKYDVRQISETDVQLQDGHQTPTKNTFYTYEGNPAWHYADDDGLSRPKRKTWNQFRGYATVAVEVGDTEKTLSRTTYLRGMHGDRAAPSGGTRTVTVGASLGSETVYDEDQFAGMAREEVIYNGTIDKPISTKVYVPWRSAATASRTINGDTVSARFVNTRVTYAAVALGVNGADGWRTSRNQTEFDDTYGTTVWSQDEGDMAVNNDEQCVRYNYNRNTTKHIVTVPRQVTTTALLCSTTPTSPDHIVSDVRNTYDGASSPATAPVYGSVTRVEQLKGWSVASGTDWQTATQNTFDSFGRRTTSSDIKNNVTTHGYLPATGLTTTVTETSPKGWVTTTVRAPYWGATKKTTDPNGRVTEADFDALGRTVKVWNAGWLRSEHEDKPAAQYEYSFSPDRLRYPYVTTRQLNAKGSYLTSYDIYDAFLRPRQTQKAGVGGGRVVTDTVYDAWGRVSASYGAHAEPGVASGGLWWEPEWSVPSMNRTVHDRAGRPTAEMFMAGDGVTNLVEKWRTTTIHAGNRTTVIPPAGGTPTTTFTDAHNRTTELRQYTTTAGVNGAFYTTQYTFDSKGQIRRVSDTGGNEWTYVYDVKGRTRETRDPDKGLGMSDYNDYNELITTTDARKKVLVYEYDTIGRKIALYDGIKSEATKRAQWNYDRLYVGSLVRGQLTETIRYDNGNVYKWQARAINQRYQVTGANYVIPASEPGLAGTWVLSYGFADADGSPTTVTYPLGGGLGAETVTADYDAVSGLPSSLTTTLPNVASYVSLQQYSAYGEPTLTQRKVGGGKYSENITSYDTSTRRMIGSSIKPETAAGKVVDLSYGYDPAGNVTSISDAPQVSAPDLQCFGYDGLRRLTSAWTPKVSVNCASSPSVGNLGGPAAYWTDWTIDEIGNRRTEVRHTATGDSTTEYTVPTSGPGVVRPHAVTAKTTTMPGQTPATAAFGYDENGNMTTRPGASGTQTLAYDSEGRLTAVNQAGAPVTTNVYDADGARLLRKEANAVTLYLPNMELRRQGSGTTMAVTATRYYRFNDKTVACRTAAGGLTWIYDDHQGTEQVTVGAESQTVAIRRQTPYGTARGAQPSWPTAKGFVGGDQDPSDLTHIGARQYDPTLGRFLSVDPIIEPADPQQLNAYAYGNNSPVTFSDPDGLRFEEETGVEYNLRLSKHRQKQAKTKGRTSPKPTTPSLPSRPSKSPPAAASCTSFTPEYCHKAGTQQATPYDIGLLWLLNLTMTDCSATSPAGPNGSCVTELYFRESDAFTEDVKEMGAIGVARDDVSRFVNAGEMSGDANRHYKGVPAGKRKSKMRWDALGIFTGGMAGSDPADAFLGSYDLKWQVVGYDDDSPVVEFNLRNASTQASATTNPGKEYPKGDGTASSGSDARRGEHFTRQHLRWRETMHQGGNYWRDETRVTHGAVTTLPGPF